ncbi:MAG: sigma-70 family RNA polymerase sigma factor [Planctomycetota bacterium]
MFDGPVFNASVPPTVDDMNDVSGAVPEIRDFETLDPDVRLMLEVQADQAAAFQELVLRYQNRLIAVLGNQVHDRDLAEELAQEVFLRVYRARKNYLPDAKFSTWIFTIAHNVAANALRSRSRRREVRLQPSNPHDSNPFSLEQLATARSGQQPTRRLDNLEITEIVKQAIESLGDQQRMALLLSKYEEMSYADIAKAMELSVSSVKSLLWRARENLRLALEPYVQEGTRPSP